MTKERIQLIVITVGIIILIALVAGGLKKKPAKNRVQAQNPAASSPAALPGKAESWPAHSLSEPAAGESDLASQKERAKLDWGRDPFSGLRAAKDYQKAELSLKGISLGKDKNGFAFINSEIVKIGDTIGEYEVTEIQKGKVKLRKGQQSFYLVLPQE